MCGICGSIYFETGRKADPVILKNMAATLSLRGPDDSGVIAAGPFGAAHTRLSIIDLDTGSQPMSNETGDVHIVFNGEIYNFREKRELLLSKGHDFKTRSDTEVILHLYEEFGEDCVEHLRGMFAFCILDEPKNRMYIARDRLGIKPLFYYADGEKFLFASELKAILAHPGVETEIDLPALDYFLSLLYVPAPLSIYRRAKKLLPGHWMTADPGGELNVRQYWRPSIPDRLISSEREAETALAALIDEAVGMRLIADVPLGAFLSGGIDSSVVVAAMSKRTKPVRTFSIGFSDKRYSELPKARIVADRFQTEHHEFVVEAKPEEVVPIMSYFDEPFADSSAIPTYYVSRMARTEVKTVLSGDGGDETFLGYRKYWSARNMQLFQYIPAPLRSTLLPALARALPDPRIRKNLPARIRFFIEKSALAGPEQYIDSHSFLSGAARRRLYSDAWRDARFDRAEFLRELFDSRRAHPLISGVNLADFRMYLPDDILTKVDRMSMANSLEVRVPLLDHKLVEFALSVSPALKLKGPGLNGGKYLLRKHAASVLPPEIVGQSKQGFQVPLRRWLRDELRETVGAFLDPSALKKQGLFNPAFVEEILPWKRETQDPRYDTSSDVWALLCFQMWYDRYHHPGSMPLS